MKRTPQLPIPESGSTIEYRNFILAFFDILGQREHLKQMGAIPRNEEERRVFEERAGVTLGFVCEFRRLFNEYFAAYMAAQPPEFVKDLPSRKRRRVLECSDIEMNFQGFSDTLIIYFPAMNRHQRYQWRAIHALLAACATLVPTLLSVGVPLRGAIEFGVGCEFVEGEIYGPVLQSAYSLESRVAGYPRIVVGEFFVQLINSNLSDPDRKEKVGVSGELYDKHMHWIGKDFDSVHIVDYLGTSAQQMLEGFTKEIIKKAEVFVRSEFERFCQERNQTLASRYFMLWQYFLSRKIPEGHRDRDTHR